MTSGPEALLEEFSVFVEDMIGVSFPPMRWNDLLRAAGEMAREEKFEWPDDCMRAIMCAAAGRTTVETLGRHFSIGETYFFRDAGTFSILKHEILPQLIAARRADGSKTMRILSAGCCSGEEAYSLSIMIHDVPGMHEWDVRIVGIDINPAFLKIAQNGEYGDWSFREVPASIKSLHFDSIGEKRYAVNAAIRRNVEFHHVNLAAQDYAVLDAVGPFDLVVCQNVLMYFGETSWRHVVSKIHGLMRSNGCLCVNPVESDRSLYPQFQPVESAGRTFFRKDLAVNGAKKGSA